MPARKSTKPVFSAPKGPKRRRITDWLGDDKAGQLQHLAAVVQGSADGIVSIDNQGRIQLFNRALQEMTGWTQPEVAGRDLQELLDPRDEGGNPVDFKQILKRDPHGGKLALPRVHICTNEQTRRWVDLNVASAIRDGRGVHAIIVVRDTSDQHELLKRQREFVSIASHELRTPITALIGYLSLLRNEDSPQQAPQFVSRAYEAALRLSELVEDLLSVARIEEGRMNLNLRPLDPAETVDHVIELMRPRIYEKKLALQVSKRLQEGDLIRADRGKLEQILCNLLDNAVKYTPEGGRVTLTARAGRDYVAFTVTDTGIGIHPHNLERIYEKFFREYSALSVSAGGTGLGLFITRELVERQGGRLTITSRQNQGTTATARFPRETKSTN